MTRFGKLRRHRAPLALVAMVLLGGALLQRFDVNPAASQQAELVAFEADQDPGLDPAGALWSQARSVQLPLSGQPGAYFAGGGSVTSVSASALHFAGTLYVRVEWSDPTLDDVSTRVEDFSDAVALEFPAQSAATIPSICMGQADAGVNIWHWRADSQQSSFDPDTVYANALVDTYPDRTDDLWYPARAVGNPAATNANGPVQTLVAQAFGALSTATVQDVTGQGAHDGSNWAVVFARPFAAADESLAEFAAGSSTNMAVAVWNGSERDRNGQKSTSQFLTLRIGSALTGGGGGDNNAAIIGLAIALFFGVTAIGVFAGYYGYRQARGEA